MTPAISATVQLAAHKLPASVVEVAPVTPLDAGPAWGPVGALALCVAVGLLLARASAAASFVERSEIRRFAPSSCFLLASASVEALESAAISSLRICASFWCAVNCSESRPCICANSAESLALSSRKICDLLDAWDNCLERFSISAFAAAKSASRAFAFAKASDSTAISFKRAFSSTPPFRSTNAIGSGLGSLVSARRSLVSHASKARCISVRLASKLTRSALIRAEAAFRARPYVY